MDTRSMPRAGGGLQGGARSGAAAASRPALHGAAGTLTTIELLERASRGEPQALERLYERYLPRLRRWARGRLPHYARDLADTEDLVQETLLRTLHNVEGVEARDAGTFHAYLRQALLNRIRDELRRWKRRPEGTDLDSEEPDRGVSALEQAIGQDALERYELALGRLEKPDREALVARIELDFSFQEVAELLGKPTADAARMTVNRALLRLAREMDHAR